MLKIDTIINNIRKYMKNNRISKHKMAINSGLHENTLSKVYDDSFNPTVETLRKCESAIIKLRNKK